MKDIETQVRRDILARQKMGVAKYGTTLANNPKLSRAYLLQHAYEETLDLAIYLKGEILLEQSEAKQGKPVG